MTSSGWTRQRRCEYRQTTVQEPWGATRWGELGASATPRVRRLFTASYPTFGYTSSHLGGASVGVLLQHPLLVVCPCELEEGQASGVSSIVSKLRPHNRFSFSVRMKRSATPLPSGSRTKLGELSMPKNAISCWKSSAREFDPWSPTRCARCPRSKKRSRIYRDLPGFPGMRPLVGPTTYTDRATALGRAPGPPIRGPPCVGGCPESAHPGPRNPACETICETRHATSPRPPLVSPADAGEQPRAWAR